MADLGFAGWAVLALCAVMVRISKTGIPGLGILVVPLMALVLPARGSTGVALGILILADLFAAGYYRRHAQFAHIVRLLPVAFAGIVAGYFGLKMITDAQLKPIIGIIVLAMLAVNWWRTRSDADAAIPDKWLFAAVMGFLAGVTTMMANAAGPVMIVYLLAMRLPKTEFVGTSAWFFFIVNWLKVPFSLHLGLVTVESAKLDLLTLPFILVGVLLGIFILRRMPQKVFDVVVQVLTAAAAIKLLF